MVMIEPKLEGKIFADVLHYIMQYKIVINKLKELVRKQKTFEEESMLYKYKGKDKDEIWSCMEFFYQNLYNKNFRDFVYSDSDDKWENYHFQLEYQGHYSEVEIVYGIGAFCVIHPVKGPTDKSKVIHLEFLVAEYTGRLTYYPV
jgi:hypothetical protein